MKARAADARHCFMHSIHSLKPSFITLAASAASKSLNLLLLTSRCAISHIGAINKLIN